MDSYTAVNMASVIAANSYYVGGNWGFVLKENEDYDRIHNILKQDNKSVMLNDVSNGCIVFVNLNYLQSVIGQVEQVDQQTLENIKNRQQIEIPQFQNFLKSVLNKTCKYGEKNNDFEEYVIGIYSCNSLHKIRLNGKEYPAYNITVKEALKQISQLSKYVKIYINVGDKFENISKIIAENKIMEVNQGLEISNTMTGVFLTIRIVRKIKK